MPGEFKHAQEIVNQDPVLFCLESSRVFANKVASSMGARLSEVEEREFEDGEHKVRPLVNVRDRDVYVVHSLYGERKQSADDKLVRLLFLIGALKDASVGRVTAMVPYLAYARKDRKTKPRDPVTTRYVAQVFEAVGTDRIVVMDVHNVAAYENAFRCRAEHLQAAPVLVRYLAPMLGDELAVVVSPDSGGVKRAEEFRRRLAQRFGRPVGLAFVEKHRSQGVVTGEAVVGDVRGAVAIVVDDLISSGTTMARAAVACRERGARRVYAVASHGVFAGAANETLAGEAFEKIVVTDSVPLLRVEAPKLSAKIECVSVADLFAEAIKRLHSGGSLVELLA